jgi:hypothetical protein
MEYKYILKLEDGREKVISINLDPLTLKADPAVGEAPDWARLDHCKCPICPYDRGELEFCPVARNLADITRAFSGCASTLRAEARVETRERIYIKETSLQSALSSIIGVYMATSGCPVLEILRPMARHHLPFATLEETAHRSVSSYLLQQYFRRKKGLEPDWELKKLAEGYKAIEVVNKAMVERVRRASELDANYNALIILDAFAKMVPLTIDRAVQDKDLAPGRAAG